MCFRLLHHSLASVDRGVIFPTYGLAEHTVYVCSNGQDRLIVDRIMLETERKVSSLLCSCREKPETLRCHQDNSVLKVVYFLGEEE